MNAFAVVVSGLSAFFLLSGESVQFGKEGVRVGDIPVQGKALTLRTTDVGPLLVSRSVVEPLSRSLDIRLQDGSVLTIQPGIRAGWAEDGIVLSTHGDREIRVGEIVLQGSAKIGREDGKWVLPGNVSVPGGRLDVGPVLVASLFQDEPKPWWKRVQEKVESSVKAFAKNIPVPPVEIPSRKVRLRRVFAEEPFSGPTSASGVFASPPNVSPGGE